MANDIKAAAWINEDGKCAIGELPPSDFVYSWKPVYTESAITQAREEGRREGMREAAEKYKSLVEAAELIAEVSDENCRFDYDGYCQSHNLDHQMDGCRVAKLRQALAAFKEKS